eukprot:m.1307686 g.1307686  ORF g.1307686 m.1307686 type:complete len:341 (+) comp24818_c0_seq20:2531-3553(+)
MSRKKLKELEELVANPTQLEEAVAKNAEIKKQLDEFYSLDYEDIVGGIPTRFKYREVVPNDFGLTMDEILTAEDKELNKWASLKKVVRYRQREEEEHDRKQYKRRRTDMGRKKEVFAESEAWTRTEKGQKGIEMQKAMVAEKIKEQKQKRIEKRLAKRAAKRVKRAEKQETDSPTTSAPPESSGAQETSGDDTSKLNHHQRRQAQRAEKRRQWEQQQAAGGEDKEGKKSRKKAKKQQQDATVGADAEDTAKQTSSVSAATEVGDGVDDVLARKRAKVSAERLAAYRSGSLKLDRQRLKSTQQHHNTDKRNKKKDKRDKKDKKNKKEKNDGSKRKKSSKKA